MLFSNIVGFVAAAFAATSMVSAAPSVGSGLSQKAQDLTTRDIDVGAALAVNIDAGACGGLGGVLVDLKVAIHDACSPLLSIGAGAEVELGVVVDVHAKVVAALKVAIDACNKIAAGGAVSVSLTVVLAVVAEICAILQILVAVLAKLTCGCVAAELAALVVEVDALLAALLKVVLTIVGGLAANLIGALVGALHLVGCLDIFVALKFVATLGVFGL
ncbi:unnamed protein product [Peniophora sp. CBMAI 1063]|nr:unnamed protein product [Peniophora sp. CBMAI 1063]